MNTLLADFRDKFKNELFQWETTTWNYGKVPIRAIRLSHPQYDGNKDRYEIGFSYWVSEQGICEAFVDIAPIRVRNAFCRVFTTAEKAQSADITIPEKINSNRRVFKDKHLYLPEKEILIVLKDLVSRQPRVDKLIEAYWNWVMYDAPRPERKHRKKRRKRAKPNLG